MKSKTWRIITPVAIAVIFTVAYIFNLDFGSLSSFGWSTISLICPLGALMTMLSLKLLIPRALIALVAAILLMFVFGRAFCAWVCPVPVFQRFRDLVGRIVKEGVRSGSTPRAALSDGTKGMSPASDTLAAAEGTNTALAATGSKAIKANGCATCAQKRGTVIDSRHIILGGSVLTALIFGFPVFCLICPVGLTFGTIFLLVNLFGHGDVTWAIIIVPALLAVEIIFFRKWCSRFCPLAAAMSLSGKVGRFFRPKINDSLCKETANGEHCGICGEVCPETIDPRHSDISESAISECTKCLICVESCPTKAIKLPVWSSENTLPQNVTPPKDK